MKVYTLTETNETRFSINRTLFRKKEDAVLEMIKRKDAIMMNRNDLEIMYKTENHIDIGWINDDIDESDELYVMLYVTEDKVY